MINIADRFFTFILENNYQEKLPKIEHINKILLIACLLLSNIILVAFNRHGPCTIAINE